MSKRKKTGGVNPVSWAAKYSQQSIAADDNIYGYNDPYLQKNEIDISRKINESVLRQKRFEQDPDAYINKELDELHDSQVQEQINKGGKGWKPFDYRPKNVNNDAYEEFVDRKLENNHSYAKNWWNHHGRRMNQFQIDDFQGYIDRTKFWQNLAQGMIDSWDIEDRVNQINQQIEQLRLQPYSLDSEQQITDLESEQRQLMQRHEELKQVRDAFDSYIPGGIKSRWYDLVAGNADEGGIANIFSNSKLFGRTSQMHDETGDFLRFTSALYTKGITRDRQRQLLQTALDTSNAKIKEWQNAIQANVKDQESYGKVDDWYQKRADAAGTDIFSADTWMYGMSGLVAGSTSGSSKIIPSMLLGAATAAATASTGGAAGFAIGAAGFAGTAGLNYAAGVAENNAEVANSYKEKIEPYLKSEKGQNKTLYDDLVKEGRRKLGNKNLTDEQVFEAFRQGKFTSDNAKINRDLYNLAIGIESQFQDDMYATTYGALLESALQVVPVGRLMPTRAMKYAVLKSAAGRKAVRAAGNSIDNIAEGFKLGSAVNPVVGAMYAPVHATIVRPAANKVGKLGASVANSIAKTTHISNYIPEQAFSTKFLSEPKRRAIKSITGNWITSSIQEGVEEGIQSISAEKYKSGQYKSPVIKSHLDSILDNVLAGSKSAALLLGMPFEGFMSEKDREILKEIKGGFLLGGLQTAMVNSSTAYFPYRSEMNAREAVANAVLMDKAQKMDDLKKGTIYAEAAKTGSSYQHMIDAFDILSSQNNKEKETSGEYGVDPEAIKTERARFEKVAQMANDAYSIKQAEAQGIKVGSKEYNEFISAKAYAEDKLDEEAEILRTTRQAHSQNVQNLTNEILTKRMSQFATDEEQTEESKNTALKEDTDNFRNIQNVAEYTALLKRKVDLELGIENAERAGKKQIVNILQKQLGNTVDRIESLKPLVKRGVNKDNLNLDSAEEFETQAVTNKEWHDMLVESYGNLILAQDDYELAKSQYKNITGEAFIDDKKVDDVDDFDATRDIDKVTFKGGKAKKVIKEIYDTLQDDDDFVSQISRDHDERTNDNEEEIITPEEKEEIEETPIQNDPEEEFKEEVLNASKKPYVQPAITVREKPVEAISSPSEPVSPEQPTVVPEQVTMYQGYNDSVDNRKYNYWTADEDEASKYGQNVRSKKINTKGFLHYYRDFDGVTQPLKKEFKALTGKSFDILDDSVEGLRTQEEFFDFLKSKGFKGVSFYETSDQEDNRYIITFDDDNSQYTKTQSEVVEELKRRAELSKSRVKKVTSEYYLIQVGDELIQMPRVHSVMPKYWYGDGSYAAALQLGNAFDNLARIFFGDIENITRCEQNMQQFVEWVSQLPVSENLENPNALNMTYGQLYENTSDLASTIYDLLQLAKQYRDLGWALSTDKIVWYSQFDKAGWVAGETDMLAVDRDGNIHIIDFKTAKGIHPFETYLNDDLYRTNKYNEQLSTLTENDFKAGPNKKGLSKAARAVKRAIRQAEGNNKNIILEWDGSRAVVRYANSEFTTNKNPQFRSGTKQQEYSDQLTAYAEMIQKSLADVVDLEIIGFRTQYTTDDKTNLVSVKYLSNQVNGKPFRIKLSFSDNMHSILNNEGSPVEPVSNPNEDVVQAKEQKETVTQTEQAEAKSNDKFVPKKPEGTLLKPAEPAPVNKNEAIGYFNINPQAIERNPELAELAASPDFISDCLQNGLVTLYTEEVTERGKKNKYLYADIEYNGKTFKRLYIWDNGTLQRKVEQLEQNKGDRRIVATAMKRTAGKIVHGKTSVPVTETSLLAGQKLEDLKFTAEDGRFGIVRKGKIISFANGDIKQPRDLYIFNQAPEGTLVFMKSLNYKECPNEKLPIIVARKSYSDSADFIIETLREIGSAEQPYMVEVNGKTINTGINRVQIMNLLMPFVNSIDDAASYSLLRDAQNPSVFHVVVRTSEAPVISVNMLNEQSVAQFKHFLQDTQMALDNRVLVSKIGSAANTTPRIFKQIKEVFGKNPELKTLQITPDVKFDRSDILGEGLSGLAWYIKSGRIVTNFEKIVSPLVSIGNVDYRGDVEAPQLDKVSIDYSTDDIDEDVDIQFFDLQKRLTSKDKNKPKLTPEQIKKNLRPILGNEVDNPAVVQIITSIATDPRLKDAAVVGMAKTDSITIYGDAFEGVEYHEAFHRIFELFVPAEQRDKVYSTISKELGVDLKSDTVESGFANHRIVAEYVADKYMDYKSGEFKTRFSWLNRILNKLRDIINALFRISDRQLYKIFLDVNSGKYQSERRTKADDKAVQRFKDMFKELNYEVRGAKFKHIINDPMYEDAKNTAFYCIMAGQDIDLSGKTVQETKINRATFMEGAERLKKEGFDIFGNEQDEKTPGQLTMTEMYVNFDEVSDDIAAMFASIATDYKKRRREETEEDLDGDEISIASSWDENFMKWDYEFSRFDKTTSRVKYFFSNIPNREYDEHGNAVLQTNGLGMPQMLSSNYVFNEVLSNLWDIDTLDELVQRLSRLSSQHPMWKQIKDNLEKVMENREDPDAEALLTQLINTIRSNKHQFMIAKSTETKEHMYKITMQTSDADYNAREYPMQWGQVLAKGGSDIIKVNENGQLIFNPKNQEAAAAFLKVARLFDFEHKSPDGSRMFVGLKQMLSDIQYGAPKQLLIWDIYGEDVTDENGETKRVYKTRRLTNLNDPLQLKRVKGIICDALSAIGINMHVQELDYMLMHKYGSVDTDALNQMINSTDEKDSIGSFLFFLNNISNGKSLNIDEAGTVGLQNGRRVPLEKVYQSLAFVKELGNWKYQYRHAHDELTVLATGNNRFYTMSDNDLFSDTIRALNKRGQWFYDLKEDPYNYSTSAEADANGEYKVYGSLILRQLTENPEMRVRLGHLIGFKTDAKGDQGQDYFEISRREDYLSKVSILESGGVISLTLSDKKKYMYIDGVKLPGLDYSGISDNNGNPVSNPDNAIQKAHSEKQGGLDQLDSVVSQFLAYAMSEYESIKRLEGKNIDVANFKKQGLLFSSLLGVWEDTYDKDGNYTGEQFISFNENTKSWEENLGIAEAYFFDRTEDEQKALIKRNLNKILDEELNTAESLGLIEKVGDNENNYLNYKNLGLNDTAIKSIAMSYTQKYPGIAPNIAESIAVVVYLNDMSCKAIMSGQEMERLLSGNPAFYKWKYNDNGQLIDRTVDELKRLGGLGSTGTNNFTELKNIPEKYKNGMYCCAEVDNEEVGSPQIEYLKKYMFESELRQNVIREKISEERRLMEEMADARIEEIRKDKFTDESDKRYAIADIRRELIENLKDVGERVTDDVDNMSIEEIKTEYRDSKILELSEMKAKAASDSYVKKIDVADGGAYITDEMCEMLLRMEGSWSKEIKEAFDILRGKVKADYLSVSEAYQKVLTTVIGNQKYTAFGRRLQDGVSIPYYHKMALFPIFECIATGKMANVFAKMKQQGIDMLLVNSAVKVGSQGSKPITWSEFRQDDDPSNEDNFNGDIANQDWKPTFEDGFSFNTYDVQFAYLRKQLNTDPKEEEMLRMGTQAQKIIFSNLLKGRLYKTQSGEEIRGEALRDRIMNSMNQLSNIGVDKLNKRFFVTDKDGNLIDENGKIITNPNSNKRQIDIKKFAKEASRLMSDRGADKNVLRALEVITSGNETKTAIPLGAISNASWLESVLISMINKDVVDVNTPGAFFIQRSVWAMQGQKMVDRSKGGIIGRKLYDGKRLMMVNEEGSMDCVLSLDFFSHILPKVLTDEYELDQDGNYTYVRDKNGKYKTDKFGNYIAKRKQRDMSFDEARKWLLDNGIIGGKANIIAYRIPTQAESSIHALRCVDVLPVVRDTVILPEEFTKITGSDFDIDKLGLSTINWSVNEKNEASDKFDEGTEKYYQNRIIRDFLTLLIDPNSINILHRSIDNDTKLLKDIIEQLESSSAKTEIPYGFYSLSTQTERKNDYITGKIGIGPFALNNNNHILTMLYGVKFRKIQDSIMSILGLTDLSIDEDFEHNSIMSWISALINAHVDIAKDPYISKLNVNPYTYNLINTLIRTGFGRNTFYFTTQPIMEELAKAHMNAASKYMANKNKTQYQLQKEATEAVADKWFNKLELFGVKYEDLKKLFDYSKASNAQARTARRNINLAFKQIVDTGRLEINAKTGTYGATVNIDGKDVKLTPEQVQMIVYFVNIQLAPYAQSVSNLVKYSKIDTKKHGKSYIEQQLYKRGFENLFYPGEDGVFEEEGLRRMAEDSYIFTKTNNAISMTTNILKGQFMQATPAFDDATKYVLGQIGRADSLSPDLNSKIAGIISAAVKSEFMNDYVSKTRPNNPSYMRDLVTESEEKFDFSQKGGDKFMTLQQDSNYDLASYIGQRAYITFRGDKGLKVGMKFPGSTFVAAVREDKDGAVYTISTVVTGIDRDSNSIETPFNRRFDGYGEVMLTHGKNTIYDRFDRLIHQIKTNPDYADMLDVAGEPINMLLRSIVHGRTYQYTYPEVNDNQEKPDTYPNLKFLKFFNAIDQGGTESNYIIDGWDELLHDTKHPLVKEFAEDLVVYAFITSGDNGGFTKMFKQVPFSWRKESGYGDFIARKISEFKNTEISKELLNDAILNNWFDNDIVRTYYFKRQSSKDPKVQIQQFISYAGEHVENGVVVKYEPLLLAALRINEDTGAYEPSIDSLKAPMYIKIPRKNYKQAKDSQRAYTVYEKVDDGMKLTKEGKWIKFPVYAKVEPKGNQLEGGYLITEYGRDDSRNKERTPNRESLSKAYKLGDFISEQVVQEMNDKFGDYSSIVESLNYRDMLRKYGEDMREFQKAYDEAYDLNKNKSEGGSKMVKSPNPYTRQSVQNDPTSLYIFTDNTDRTSGGKEYEDGWYKQKYGAGGYGSEHNPTTAQIRGLDNAAPISTMKYFYRLHDGMSVAEARWNDSDIEEFKKVIDSEIQDIKDLWDTGKFTRIVTPSGDGFFNSRIAQISKTSKIGEYLNDKLKELHDYINNPVDDSELTPEEQEEANKYKQMCEGK